MEICRMSVNATQLEKESLEAHVDLCALRYEQMDKRLTAVEEKIDDVHEDIKNGQQSMVKVLIGSAGTIVAGLLSTIIVILLQ
jgi:tetrahydromethanopterin S-methyltransferase subunit G